MQGVSCSFHEAGASRMNEEITAQTYTIHSRQTAPHFTTLSVLYFFGRVLSTNRR
jgi:hypothetical protein